MEMIVSLSEDEQLLQKTFAGLQDYLQISHYFDLKEQFGAIFRYLCSVIPSLITARTNMRSLPNPPAAAPPEAPADDIQAWKTLHLLRFFLRSTTRFSASIEGVGAAPAADAGVEAAPRPALLAGRALPPAPVAHAARHQRARQLRLPLALRLLRAQAGRGARALDGAQLALRRRDGGGAARGVRRADPRGDSGVRRRRDLHAQQPHEGAAWRAL